MKHIVIHREQVSCNLKTEIYDNVDDANKRRSYLRKQYHDTVILSEQELLELKLRVNSHASKTI
tara:strand:+ start:302 stop:493 length:192 start_codon:yes stop_codon:yes gene_type:complete